MPPDTQKSVANGVVPPANGHVPNGLVAPGRSPPQPGSLGVGAGTGVYQDPRVQLAGAFQPAASTGGFFSKPGTQNGAAQPTTGGGEFPRSAQHQSGYQQREAPRPPTSWAPPDPASGHPAVSWAAAEPSRPTSGHAGGPPAAALRHPYQPSPSRQPVPPVSSAAGGSGGGQPGSAVTSRTDGNGAAAGAGRATLQWGAPVPPPAYSLPRQQQRPEEAPPASAATLPAGAGHDRSRPGEPPPAGPTVSTDRGLILPRQNRGPGHPKARSHCGA